MRPWLPRSAVVQESSLVVFRKSDLPKPPNNRRSQTGFLDQFAGGTGLRDVGGRYSPPDGSAPGPRTRWQRICCFKPVARRGSGGEPVALPGLFLLLDSTYA